jgi:hypothetical protein
MTLGIWDIINMQSPVGFQLRGLSLTNFQANNILLLLLFPLTFSRLLINLFEMGSSLLTMMLLIVSLAHAMTLAELGEASMNLVRSGRPEFNRNPYESQQFDYHPSETEYRPTRHPELTNPSGPPPNETSPPANPQPYTPPNECPAIWQTIVADLSKRFLGEDGQCNNDARAAIRVSDTVYAIPKRTSY